MSLVAQALLPQITHSQFSHNCCKCNMHANKQQSIMTSQAIHGPDAPRNARHYCFCYSQVASAAVAAFSACCSGFPHGAAGQLDAALPGFEAWPGLNVTGWVGSVVYSHACCGLSGLVGA